MADKNSTPKLTIKVIPGDYAVCQLPPGTQMPDIPDTVDLYAKIQTSEEVTVICPEEAAPPYARLESGWRVLKVVGPLDFSLVGILAHLASRLADAEISIFALSTYDTDYLLVKAENLPKAKVAMKCAGHQIT